MPIEIRELLVEPQDEPATAAPTADAPTTTSGADVVRVVETLRRTHALRADRLRAD